MIVKPKDCVTLPEFLTKRIVEQASKKYEWEHKKVQEVHTLMKDSPATNGTLLNLTRNEND